MQLNRAHGSSDEGYSIIVIPQPSPIRLVDCSLLMPGQTHLLFRQFCLFRLSTPLRGVCIRGEAGKSGVARNTACPRTPKRCRRDGGLRDTALRRFGEGKRAAAGMEGFGTPRQPFWSAVASGISRDTALRRFGEGKEELPPGRRASGRRASHFGVRWQAVFRATPL